MDGDLLTLWTHPNFPKINAYAPNSIRGSGLVLALDKEENKYLADQFDSGRIESLKIEKQPGKSYAIVLPFNDLSTE